MLCPSFCDFPWSKLGSHTCMVRVLTSKQSLPIPNSLYDMSSNGKIILLCPYYNINMHHILKLIVILQWKIMEIFPSMSTEKKCHKQLSRLPHQWDLMRKLRSENIGTKMVVYLFAVSSYYGHYSEIKQKTMKNNELVR